MTDAGRRSPSCLAAAEPAAPGRARRPHRPPDREGRLRGARRDGRAIGPAGLADVAVRGVTNDSRAVRPGLAVRRGPRAPRRRPRLRRGGGRGRRGRRDRRARRSPRRRSRSSSSRQPPPRSRRPRRGGTATRAATWRGRHHRHGRQDDDLVPRGRGARGGRHPDRDDRHGRDADRRRPGGQRGARHDPGGTGPPARARGRWSSPATGRRRRDDVARPRARPRRRHRLRRRDPDQPDPRAPRAPRHVGGVPRRQALACSSGSRGRAGAAAPSPASRWPATGIVNADDPLGRRVHRRRPRRPARAS